MSSDKGEQMSSEACNSLVEMQVRLIKPKPPKRVGKENKSRSKSLGAALPVRGEMSVHQMTSSTGWKRDSISGMVLHKKVNLCTKP